MARLDIQRQNNLTPPRKLYAKNRIIKMGFEVTKDTDTYFEFLYKGNTIRFYPYSGWATGKSIKDGRGLNNLLKQLV